MRDVIRIYAKAGSVLGLVIGFAMFYAMGLLQNVRDLIVFSLYHGVLFLVSGLLFGIALHLVFILFGLFRGPCSKEAGVRFHRVILSGLVAGIFVSILIIELKRPFLINRVSIFILMCCFLGTVALVWKVFLPLFERVGGSSGRRGLSALSRSTKTIILGVFLALLIISITHSYRGPDGVMAPPEKAETGYKVMVIGLDGADWKVIDRLIDAGVLPNLSQIISNGVRADLRSEATPLNPTANTSSGGMRSAVVWTSIATGKTARAHGLHDFMVAEITGLSQPVPARVPTWNLFKKYVRMVGLVDVSRRKATSSFRKGISFWEILSECGYDVGVLGWWLLDTSRPVNGYKVSTSFTRPERLFFPATLLERKDLISIIPHRDSRPDLAMFTSFEFEPDYKTRYEESDREYFLNQIMGMLASDFKRDLFIRDTGLTLLSSWPVDLFAIYFLGPDNVEHVFWKFMEPEHFEDVTDRDIELFGKVIDRYYMFLDRTIGELDALRDENTVLVICSDHGMGPWVGNRSFLYKSILQTMNAQNSGNHREDGILILEGGPFRQGITVKDATIHDVAPTILHVEGLPTADDMDGEVLIETFRDEYRAENPVRTVESYQGLMKSTPESAGEETNDQEEEDYRKRLKTLGYIDS